MPEQNEQKDVKKAKLSFAAQFKKFFVSGLIAILPLWLTLYILWILFTWIGSLTRPFLRPIFYLVVEKETDITLLLQITSFFLTLIVVYLVGVLVTNIASKKLMVSMENILLRIPILRSIYLAVRKLIQYLFSAQQQFKEYRRVVLLEFPKKDVYQIGFVTSEQIMTDKSGNKLVCVFIPTTPNPTTGWLAIVSEQELIPVKLNIDQAIKMILSGGIIHPGTIERDTDVK